MSTTLDQALAYHRLGYVPLWVEPNSKASKSAGWQTSVPTEDSIRRHFARPSNLGIRTGDLHPDGTCLVAIDIDLEDASLIGCVERAIGQKVPCKQGKKGFTYFVRLDGEAKSRKLHWYRDGTKKPAIDLLGRHAQTVVPPSIHPDTGLPYRWVAGTPLTELPYVALPVFSDALLDEINGFCRSIDDPVVKLNNMQWCGVGGGGDTHDTCLAAVASMVTRGWQDEDIQSRVSRAKQEACAEAGLPFDWPDATKTIREWIDSARAKFGSDPGAAKRLSHGAFADEFLSQTSFPARFDRDRRTWFSLCHLALAVRARLSGTPCGGAVPTYRHAQPRHG